MYAVYHGPNGLKEIATRVHKYTTALAHALQQRAPIRASDDVIINQTWFDTLKVKPAAPIETVKQRAAEMKVNLRYFSDGCVCFHLVFLI